MYIEIHIRFSLNKQTSPHYLPLLLIRDAGERYGKAGSIANFDVANRSKDSLQASTQIERVILLGDIINIPIENPF